MTDDSSRKRTILVVDDHVDSAKMLELFLSISGHEVRTVHDGETALDAVADFVPEVIFLDIGLPGMDGYEVARRLRQMETMTDAVLVAMTGFSGEDERQRAREAGFDHYLVKPADPSALESLLQR